MTDATPLVSVLMTAFNREKYIAEAIESVLQSTFQHFELIVVDDCSTDNTYNIACSFAEKDQRVRVFLNESNLGDYPNRNKAASYATGKYLKYLDADDLIYPHGLEVMVRQMEQFPDAGFGLSFSVIDDTSPYPRLLSSADIITGEFLGKSYVGVGPSASIISRQAFLSVGGFSGTQFIGDTELWLTLAGQFPMVLMNPSLNWWRQHPDQQMVMEKKNAKVKIKRLNLSLHFLKMYRHLFSEQEYRFAEKRIKQNFARNMLADLKKYRDVRQFTNLYRGSGIGFVNLLSGLKGYL